MCVPLDMESSDSRLLVQIPDQLIPLNRFTQINLPPFNLQLVPMNFTLSTLLPCFAFCLPRQGVPQQKNRRKQLDWISIPAKLATSRPAAGGLSVRRPW